MQTLPFPCIEDGVKDQITKIRGDSVLIIEFYSRTCLQWFALQFEKSRQAMLGYITS